MLGPETGLAGTADDLAPMAPGGALSNPEAAGALRQLAEVVRKAAGMPERDEPPKVERPRRPGWAMPMVRSVLEEASAPMTPMEIAREIERRFGEPIPHPTVFHVLTRSRAARNKAFERVEPAKYRLAERRERTAPVG